MWRSIILSVTVSLALLVPSSMAADLAPGDVQMVRVKPHRTATMMEKKLYSKSFFLLVWVYDNGKLMDSDDVGALWSSKGVVVYVDIVKGRGRIRAANFTDKVHRITVRFVGVEPGTPAP